MQVDSPDGVRNVVLIGNAGSGKTTLFEQLLKARVPGYRGEKEDAERAAQLFVASFATGDVVVNLLDAPGHPDFVGELRAGIRAADAAIFVLSAADDIDGAAQALWEECREANLPRVIVLTKLDAGHADFDDSVEQCQAVFGDGVRPTHVPTYAGPGQVVGNIGLLSLEEHDYSAGEPVSRTLNAHDDQVEAYRGPLIESIIAEAEDEGLMDSYLEDDEHLSLQDLLDDLMKAVATANLFPVVPVQTGTGVGIEELLRLIEHGFPTPGMHPNPPLTTTDGEVLPQPDSDPSAPLVAQVIRTTTDPFAGRLSMVRIFSGTLHSDDVVHVSGHRSWVGREDSAHPDHDNEERIGLIQGAVGTELKPRQQAIAGEIVLLPKLGTAETCDTLSAKDRPGVVEAWPLPDPLLPLAIRAATRNDEDKLAGALQRLAVEDSSVRLDRGAGDQLVLWTTGQAHADLLLGRLVERYGVRVEQEELKIPMRETFTGAATAMGRHVKQSGGHGQYAVCNIEVEPLDRGAGFEFVDKVVGGAVPRQFIPSVEKGIRNQLEKGVFAGYPMVDVRVTLYDGKAHSVDSSDMAFQMAGALAIKEAASNDGAVALLEPLDLVTVTVGEEYLGPVMTDLSGRRGQLLGSDQVGRKAVVKALVPQAELARYAIDLRGIAHGSGSFTRDFHGYELLPSQLLAKYRK
ncbi:elongation factor G-like protein EF-G2 [Micropruina sonneratiae]|uniref:elongation factor G-like protein EF-G2 n=1 Tax=Micropruina sonneratiae TaxID=2986940 RepID=UPI002227AAF9|nr:elongation factor G-like protein EF-G2 [Micropruina sp. KQZ13P-5]MCW3156915.1 elongation factor G-like protein EF-G2 [Micropruina sp. KQZ13P-5]